MENILCKYLTFIISETNGISITDTIDLLLHEKRNQKSTEIYVQLIDFKEKLSLYNEDKVNIGVLLDHPVSRALEHFFKQFPLRYHEDHIHLTGSLTADFIYPRLMKLIQGPQGLLYRKKIKEVYGEAANSIESIDDVNQLIRLKEEDGFKDYLKILYLPKLILLDRESHFASAYHLASQLYYKFNIGKLRLKFSISRASTLSGEQIPGVDTIKMEDVIMGIYEGLKEFKKQHPGFDFILSPSFRKEIGFFDANNFKNRKDHFENLVDQLIELIKNNPDLGYYITDIDTVGDESDFYRKGHFNEFKKGFRKLQYLGFKVRSHHGETFQTLKKGIQAVDNAMNIWHIDTLEHGLSLGINPNYYFHRLYQRVIDKNERLEAIKNTDVEYKELLELDWPHPDHIVLNKLLLGEKLTSEEKIVFLKSKFHTAREVEHYQHDVLNRLIQKKVNLVTLPSSNNKLTGKLEEYKDHPFSWWEKKGLQLSLGTDNYITLNTNYIREMLILLYTDSKDLKITKLLMVTTHENRRPYLSYLLWQMRKKYAS